MQREARCGTASGLALDGGLGEGSEGSEALNWLADYEALRSSVGARRGTCDLIEAQGPDAMAFLNGQLSQDVSEMGIWESARTLLLRPDGKLECALRVHRLGAELFWLDASPGEGERALARLERFKLRTDCSLALSQASLLTVLGPKAPPLDAASSAAEFPNSTTAPLCWGSLRGWERIGGGGENGLRECAEEAFEALRIESGVPAAGRELLPGLIPAETGLVSETVSFTKGCFVGQELVARIDSRGGNTPRRLRGVLFRGTDLDAGANMDALPPEGALLLDADGAEAGRLTSVSYSPALRAVVALAYVKRKVAPPASVTVQHPDGSALRAEVRELPLAE